MLSVLFSPLSLFNRTHSSAAVVLVDSGDVHGHEHGLDEHDHRLSSHASAESHADAHAGLQGHGHGHVRHHALHPPPPEVPEAAESELDEDVGGGISLRGHGHGAGEVSDDSGGGEDEAEVGEEEDEDDDFTEFDPLLFIRMLPPLEECVPKYRPVLLPRKTRKCKLKTLVLDLDETLVHSSLEHASNPDFSFDVRFNNQVRRPVCMADREIAEDGRAGGHGSPSRCMRCVACRSDEPIMYICGQTS